jgi:hypothetical protein
MRLVLILLFICYVLALKMFIGNEHDCPLLQRLLLP